ncbi:unnamed protein product [Oikopleura dioica]|uniref:Glutaredoxin n=1 Tax=Oikopleura dioica TaxID=34765 RepID=E4XSB9_OIKDI|nr:unnamed protein product [Oikopleura dioica]CBY43421.1 unnamed protein product [Oikopleura dioica]
MFRRLAQSLVRTTQFRFVSHDYQAIVNAKKCVVFMKGTPDAPQCGFSRAVIQMLEAEGVDLNNEISAHNILEEDGMREEMKEFSDWPTFPQVYLNGEFYGGCDIMYDDYKNEKLRGILLEAKLTLPEH